MLSKKTKEEDMERDQSWFSTLFRAEGENAAVESWEWVDTLQWHGKMILMNYTTMMMMAMEVGKKGKIMQISQERDNKKQANDKIRGKWTSSRDRSLR